MPGLLVAFMSGLAAAHASPSSAICDLGLSALRDLPPADKSQGKADSYFDAAPGHHGLRKVCPHCGRSFLPATLSPTPPHGREPTSMHPSGEVHRTRLHLRDRDSQNLRRWNVGHRRMGLHLHRTVRRPPRLPLYSGARRPASPRRP